MSGKKDSLLEKLRELNVLMQNSTTNFLSMEGLCDKLGHILDANVYIVDNDGAVLGTYFAVEEDSPDLEDPATGERRLPETYAEELAKIDETAPNLTNDALLKVLKFEASTKEKPHTIIPVLGSGQRWGSMILARYDSKFSEEDLVLCELGATLVGFEIQQEVNQRLEEEAQREEVVQMALGSLSYSEYEAVTKIFEELDGEEGILVASKVADRSRITRSVIVNALRKLESAGVIESKSLGMKGTHIKVLNDKFLPAIGLDK